MTTVNGLPAHILLVHAIVVLLPLAALLLVLTAVWPSARRLAGANVVLSVAVVALVPVTTDAGEWLERRVPATSLVRDHAELGDSALAVAVPVAVMAVVIWWRIRQRAAIDLAVGRTAATAAAVPDRGGLSRRAFLAPLSRTVTGVIAALAVVVAGVAGYDVYRIGDSGARAAWQNNFSSTPAPEPSGFRRRH